MPNHITNVIQAPGYVLTSLITVTDEKPVVDFGNVIPMPDENDPIFTATKTDYGNGMVGYSMDGYSPLEWNRENWGTKWNGYSANFDNLENGELKFDTAWNHPTPVIEALSRMWPDSEIIVRYADEDMGSNVGEYTMLNGEIIDSHIPDYSPESLDLAADIMYGMTYAELKKTWDDDDDE